MVFLFIAYLVTIVLITFPIDIGLYLFYDEKENKFHITFKTFGISKYIPQKEKFKNKKAIKSKKKSILKSKIAINKKGLISAIKMPIIERFNLTISTPKVNPAIYFPIIGIFKGAENIMKRFGLPAFELSQENNAAELYFQLILDFKINLFIIFSALFQIIRIKSGRK